MSSASAALWRKGWSQRTKTALIRIVTLALLLWFSITVVFFLTRVLGDPVRAIAGVGASPEQLAQIRATHGLDQHLLGQYRDFIGSLLTGDWQHSLYARRPAIPMVIARIPASLVLAAAAISLSITAGVPTAVVAAVKRDRWIGRLAERWTLITATVADFWVGLLLIAFVAVHLGWTATSGYALDVQHLLLPAVTLAIRPYGRLSRVLLGGLKDELSKDYVQLLRAKGVTETRIVVRHALRPAAGPAMTVAGYDLAYALSAGAILVETIFSWPGVGFLAYNAVVRRDFPIVEAVALTAFLLITLVNSLVDVANTRLDPRIRR